MGNCNNQADLGVLYYKHSYFFDGCVQEILGSIIVVLFFMMMTDETMLFSREKAINCFIIASGYIAARAMFAGTQGATRQISIFGACLNPAIAVGIFFAALCSGGYGWDAFADIWIYIAMPFVGAFLAILFFEFAYKKTQEALEHGDGADKSASVSNEIYEENPLAE